MADPKEIYPELGTDRRATAREVSDMLGPVGEEAGQVREWIRHVTERLDITPTALARAAELAPSTLNRFLAGKAPPENLNLRTVEKLKAAIAKLYRPPMHLTPAPPLTGRPAPPTFFVLKGRPTALKKVRVVGHVEAGDWQEAAQWPSGNQYPIEVPIAAPLYQMPIVGLEVRGDSMNVIYPAGTIVLGVSFYDLGRGPRSGERVVVQAHQPSGLVESTVKEFVVDPQGNAWLVPRSTNPAFKPQFLHPNRTETDEELTITLLVIGSYRPEPVNLG